MASHGWEHKTVDCWREVIKKEARKKERFNKKVKSKYDSESEAAAGWKIEWLDTRASFGQPHYATLSGTEKRKEMAAMARPGTAASVSSARGEKAQVSADMQSSMLSANNRFWSSRRGSSAAGGQRSMKGGVAHLNTLGLGVRSTPGLVPEFETTSDLTPMGTQSIRSTLSADPPEREFPKINQQDHKSTMASRTWSGPKGVPEVRTPRSKGQFNRHLVPDANGVMEFESRGQYRSNNFEHVNTATGGQEINWKGKFKTVNGEVMSMTSSLNNSLNRNHTPRSWVAGFASQNSTPRQYATNPEHKISKMPSPTSVLSPGGSRKGSFKSYTSGDSARSGKLLDMAEQELRLASSIKRSAIRGNPDQLIFRASLVNV